MTELLLGAALMVASGIVSLALPGRWKKLPVVAGCVAGALAVAVGAVPALVDGGASELRVELGFPFGETRWALDPLSALFAAIAAAGGLLAPIHSVGYLRREEGKPLALYWFALPLLVASMLLVFTARNALAFLVAWELMSLSSFLLASFDAEEPEVLSASLYYLVAMQVGLAFLIAAFALLGSRAGSLDFDAIAADATGLTPTVFLLFLAGFGTKMGLLPFHGWLPKAHPAAPSPVSALMSGVMIKTGVYGLVRLLALSGAPEPWMAWMLLSLSAATGVFGALQAAAARDLKRLLAWSTVENAGIIGVGIGLGMLGRARGDQAMAVLGYGAALLHCVNHFVAKSLLFFGAGSVYAATGTRDLERLGGLAKRMPITAAAFIAGSAAICALPPFGCFVAEFCLYLGALGAGTAPSGAAAAIFAVASLALIGALSLVAFVKADGIAFLGEPRSETARGARESPPSMLLPMTACALASLALGLFPKAALGAVFLPAAALAAAPGDSFAEVAPALPAAASGVATGAMAFLAVAAALLGLRALLLRGRAVRRSPTWGCGYRGATSRMQYTAGSFASPLALLFKGALAYRERRLGASGAPEGRPDGEAACEATCEAGWLFPPEGRVEASAGDPVELGAVEPSTRALDRFLGLFSWVQSGYTQQYILYGLGFLVIAAVWLAVAP